MSTDAERLVDAITRASDATHPDDVLWPLFRGLDQPVRTWEVNSGRWERTTATAYRLPDGTHAAIEYTTGATEYQDPPPSATAYEVEPYEKTVTRYRKRESAPSSPVEGTTTTEDDRV